MSEHDRSYVTVFDLDDTLYPELDFARSGMRAVGELLERELGIQGATQRLLSDLAQGIRHNNFDEILSSIPSPPEGLLPRLVKRYRNHSPCLRLEAQSRSALNSARKLGPTALITDGPAAMQRAKVAALGIAPLFDCMIFSDELGTNKPDPLVYQAVERQLRGNEYCYVADNPEKDFITARRRGWRTIRLVRTDAMYTRISPSALHDAEVEIEALTDMFRHWPHRNTASS